MRPDPTINANAQRTGRAPAASPWTLGLKFDISIETAGKRGYRVEEASQLSEAARAAIAGTAWQVRSRVRDARLDLLRLRLMNTGTFEMHRLHRG